MRCLLITALAMLAGCGGGDGGTGPTPQPLGIAGTWDLNFVLTTDVNDCSYDGVVTYAESGSELSGTIDVSALCHLQGVEFGLRFMGPVTGRVLSGTTFEWEARNTVGEQDPFVCNFEGSVSGTPVVGQAGTVRCMTRRFNTPGGFPTDGSWEASR